MKKLLVFVILSCMIGLGSIGLIAILSIEKFPGIESVVHIINDTQNWQGSGVAIAPDLILTARHVVEGGEDFTITLNGGTEIKATEAISHKENDIAFIKISEAILKPAKLGSIKDCKLGDDIYVIGSPYGKLNFNSLTTGIISGLDRNLDKVNIDYGWRIIFSTDAAGHPGNSGCPVFTSDGVVRGILVGGYSPVLIYCVPVDIILDDLEYIKLLFGIDKYYYEEKAEYSYEYEYEGCY